jgi:hypothetical protein
MTIRTTVAVGPYGKEPRVVALDMAVCKFVLIKHILTVVPIERILTRVPTRKPMNASMADILDPSLSAVVDQRGHVSETKMLGEKIVIIGVTVCINVGLHSRDDVGILCRGTAQRKMPVRWREEKYTLRFAWRRQ